MESFPHPTALPIIGHPSYETISKLNLKVKTDATSIYSHRGDRRLDILYLTVKPAVYNIQSTTLFGPPVNPGQNPTIPDNSMGPQIAEFRR